MHRLLHRHQWSDIHEWVGALGTLADLTDAEIEQVAIPRRQDPDASEGKDEDDDGVFNRNSRRNGDPVQL